MATDSLRYYVDLVWRGGRDAARASDDIEQVGQSGQRSQRSLSSMIGTAASWGAAIAGAAITARQAWQALGEGAELQLVGQRYEALAGSIGTTGDHLLAEMQSATSGMISNAELMSTASTIINVGLQDTENGVVRLSRVIGELGLDMQQVILTMANDSKLRLDSLGLSVTGVTERQKELNAAGMAMEDAFDVAVLELLEQKLELVGSAANTAAGDIKRMEADWANLVNSAKQGFAHVVAPFLAIGRRKREMEETARAIAATSSNYDEFVRNMRAAGMVDQLTAERKTWLLIQEQWFEAARTQELAQRRTEAYAAEMQMFARQQGEVTEATEASTDALAIHEALLVDAQANTRIYNSLAAERSRVDAAVMETVAAGNQAAAEAMGITQARIERQREMNQVFARGFVPALEAGEDAEVDFNQALLESLASLGAAPEVLNSAAFATGNYTAEQIESAIQARVMAAAVEEAAAAVVAGDMSVMEATQHLEDLWQQLQADYKMTFDVGDIEGAQGQVQRLIDLLNQASGTYEARVIIASQGTGGVGPQAVPQIRQHGGRVYPGETYWVGEAGPEPFVPDRPGTIVPNRLAGGDGEGGGFQMNGNIIIQLEGPVTNPAAFAKQAAPALMNEMNSQMRGG